METNKDLVVTDDIGFETTRLYKYNAITGKVNGKITACPTKYLAYHDADTRGNQSGSPIYDTDQIVWAVHNAAGTSYNVSQKITSELFHVIKKEKQESIAEWNA